MARSCGGWERLLADLPAVDRARLAVKLADAADDLRRRSDQAAARASMAVKDASRDPGCIQAAAQILKAAGWKIEPP